MSHPGLLQIGTLPPSLEEALGREFDRHNLQQQDAPDAFLRQHGSRFAAIAMRGHLGLDARTMDALPHLRVIASFGVGYEKIDVQAAASRGIAVSNTPDVLNECVADIAFGLMIDVARGAVQADRFVRSGKWLQGPYPLKRSVYGKRLGILGLGRIGQAIARRAEGFGMTMRYHNRRPVQGLASQYEASLLELAKWSDFLVIAAVGGPQTSGLVSAQVIDALGAQGYLINIARSSIVDEAALIGALRDGRLAGAGLDVFTNEPHVPEALLQCENAVLLPHIGSATQETRKAMADLVLENLRAFFKDGRLLTPVRDTAQSLAGVAADTQKG